MTKIINQFNLQYKRYNKEIAAKAKVFTKSIDEIVNYWTPPLEYDSYFEFINIATKSIQKPNRDFEFPYEHFFDFKIPKHPNPKPIVEAITGNYNFIGELLDNVRCFKELFINGYIRFSTIPTVYEYGPFIIKNGQYSIPLCISNPSFHSNCTKFIRNLSKCPSYQFFYETLYFLQQKNPEYNETKLDFSNKSNDELSSVSELVGPKFMTCNNACKKFEGELIDLVLGHFSRILTDDLDTVEVIDPKNNLDIDNLPVIKKPIENGDVWESFIFQFNVLFKKQKLPKELEETLINMLTAIDEVQKNNKDPFLHNNVILGYLASSSQVNLLRLRQEATKLNHSAILEKINLYEKAKYETPLIEALSVPLNDMETLNNSRNNWFPSSFSIYIYIY